MSDEKTLTGTSILANFGATRGRRAAFERGWKVGHEPEAFADGARWMLEKLQEEFTLTPNDKAAATWRAFDDFMRGNY